MAHIRRRHTRRFRVVKVNKTQDYWIIGLGTAAMILTAVIGTMLTSL